MKRKCVISIVIFLASILFCPTDIMAIEQCGVIVFDSANDFACAKGICYHFSWKDGSPISLYKNPWGGFNWSDRISALKILGNATVTLYEHGPYSGTYNPSNKKETYISDVPDLRKTKVNILTMLN